MTTNNLDSFREEAKSWISENFPRNLAGTGMGLEGEANDETRADMELWRSRLADKGCRSVL